MKMKWLKVMESKFFICISFDERLASKSLGFSCICGQSESLHIDAFGLFLLTYFLL